MELGAVAGHPHVQRKHVMMLACDNFVANLGDQFVLLVAKPLTGMIGFGSGLLQYGISGDHLTRNQIVADVEMLERALGLSAPKFVGGDFYPPPAFRFFSFVGPFGFPLLSLFFIILIFVG